MSHSDMSRIFSRYIVRYWKVIEENVVYNYLSIINFIFSLKEMAPNIPKTNIFLLIF